MVLQIQVAFHVNKLGYLMHNTFFLGRKQQVTVFPHKVGFISLVNLQYLLCKKTQSSYYIYVTLLQAIKMAQN